MADSTSTPWHVPGRWIVSKAYWEDEALELRKNMRKKVRFIDCTMPEGTDTVGCVLDWSAHLEFIQRLDEVGVGGITMPSHSKLREEEDLARAFRRLNLKAEMVKKGPSIHFPLGKQEHASGDRSPGAVEERLDWKSQADRVAAMTVDTWCFETGGSENISHEDFVEQLAEVIHYAKSKGIKNVCPWVGTTMRESPSVAAKMLKVIAQAGGDGAYIMDSRGNSHPLATRVYVRAAREAIGEDKRLYVHHHNDMGIATANALADVEAGSDWVDATVLGVGDRGGTVSLEEAACLLEMYGVDTGIHLEGLYDLCRFVRDAYGVKLAPWKAIIGDNWNMEEGRGHLGNASESEVSFGIAPEAVGSEMEMVIGGKILFGKERSSSWTDEPLFIDRMLEEYGIETTQEQRNRILLRAQTSLFTKEKRYLSFDEFRHLVEGVVNP